MMCSALGFGRSLGPAIKFWCCAASIALVTLSYGRVQAQDNWPDVPEISEEPQNAPPEGANLHPQPQAWPGTGGTHLIPQGSPPATQAAGNDDSEEPETRQTTQSGTAQRETDTDAQSTSITPRTTPPLPERYQADRPAASADRLATAPADGLRGDAGLSDDQANALSSRFDPPKAFGDKNNGTRAPGTASAESTARLTPARPGIDAAETDGADSPENNALAASANPGPPPDREALRTAKTEAAAAKNPPPEKGKTRTNPHEESVKQDAKESKVASVAEKGAPKSVSASDEKRTAVASEADPPSGENRAEAIISKTTTAASRSIQAKKAEESQSAETAKPIQAPDHAFAPAASPKPANHADTAAMAPRLAPVSKGRAPATTQALSVVAARTTQAEAAASNADIERDALDAMIGQVLLVTFEGTEPSDDGVRRVVKQIENGEIAGVLLTARNIRSPKQLKALTRAFLTAKHAPPPILMIAHEGGSGQALSPENGFVSYPSAAALGRSNDPLNAFTVYQNMANELKRYGFNANLGPVIDMAVPAQGAGGDEKAFGSSPKHVAAFAKAFCLAHRETGIMTVLKHFPVADRTGEAAKPTDADQSPVEPLRQLVASGIADMVMTTHRPSAELTGDTAGPVSFSDEALAVLRQQIGFDGVILSADLESALLPEGMSLQDRARQAIKAGNDMLLFAGTAARQGDLPAKINRAIHEAVETGDLSRAQIEAAYDRITALKARLDASSTNAVAAASSED